jgi:NAD+ kinase
MDSFLIITNKEKDLDLHLTKKIAASIVNAGKRVVLSSVSSVQEENKPVEIPSGVECAIALGGDGTIIQTANDLMKHDIPILGVNLGTLGFLAEVEAHHVDEALDRLFKKDYRVENRIMMRNGNYHSGQKDHFTQMTGYALNEVVIAKKVFPELSVWVFM